MAGQEGTSRLLYQALEALPLLLIYAKVVYSEVVLESLRFL